MHLLSQIIYSCKTLYMFRTVFPSIIRSSKLRIQQWYMSNSCCYILLSGMRWNFSSSSSPIAAGSSSCLTYTIAVYAVLSSWWWTERPSETCRAFYKNKSFEIIDASCWLYYRNILRCTNLLIVNNKINVYLDILLVMLETKLFFQTDFEFTWTIAAYPQANKLLTCQESTQSKVNSAIFGLWSHIDGEEVQLHTFLTSALDGCEWSISYSGRFDPGKEPRYPWNRRVCMGPQRENSLDLSGIRTPDRTDHSLVTTLYQFLKFNVKKTLRKIREKSSRVYLKDIIACCVVTNQKPIRIAARTEAVF
jgi:hypothetical protein